MPSIDPELVRLIESTTGRVTKIEHGGAVFWVKRQESLDLRMRLQKGDSSRAFRKERDALHRLFALGAPVPEIVYEGAEFFVTPDCGVPLDVIIRDGFYSEGVRKTIFEDAARSLAGMHQRGISHGHPRIKDICWDGEKTTYIDLERHRESLNTPFGHARDVITFFFSCIAVPGRETPELFAARDAYRQNDPGGIWIQASRISRMLTPIAWITKPIRMQSGEGAADFKAIPKTVRFFRDS